MRLVSLRLHSTTLFEKRTSAPAARYDSQVCKGLQDNKTRRRSRPLSRIFLWYAGDFESRGGSPTYAARYAPAGAARDALATMAPSYFAYDWNLNTQ